jgi:hypothetical protein
MEDLYEEEVWYGMTRWSIDDVKCLAPEWTDEQCHEFMERHDRHFEDRMIELGWEVDLTRETLTICIT